MSWAQGAGTEGMTPMADINNLVRFGLELAGIVSVAYWGYHAATETWARFAIAAIVVAVLVGFWAFVVAPGADNPISPTVRMLIGSGVLLFSAVGLFVAGQPTPAFAFAALIIVNTVIALVVGG